MTAAVQQHGSARVRRVEFHAARAIEFKQQLHPHQRFGIATNDVTIAQDRVSS